MKNKFVLPEKWYMKPVTSDEDCKVIYDWMHNTQVGGNHWEFRFGKEYILHYHGEEEQTNGYVCIQEGYVKITFKQFQQYVLKTKPVKQKKQSYNYLIPILKKYNVI